MGTMRRLLLVPFAGAAVFFVACGEQTDGESAERPSAAVRQDGEEGIRRAGDPGASEEARAGRTLEQWAAGMRARNARRVCELTYFSPQSRRTPRECLADVERSQEFGLDVRFVAQRVEISGAVARVDTKIIEGTSPAESFRFELRRVADQWKFVVPAG